MTTVTPEATAELLLRYKERNKQRLQQDSHSAVLRGLGDSWFVLRAAEAMGEQVPGIDINDLRGRYRFLEPLIARQRYSQREYSYYLLADGMHVKDDEEPEFEHTRQIYARLIPEILLSTDKDLNELLGVYTKASFTTGAAVLSTAIVDLGRLSASSAFEMGKEVLKAHKGSKPLYSIIRTIAVTEGLANWVDIKR